MERNGYTRWLHIVGALLLILSAPLGWLNQPWGGWTRAAAWKPLSPPDNAKFALVSMGTLLVAIALASLLPWLRRHTSALAAVALLVLFLPVRQLLFTHVGLCETLADEVQQKTAVLEFDRTVLGGKALEFLDFPQLDSETILGRFGSLQHLLGWGWYVAALGVILLAASGWRATKRPHLWVIVSVLVIILSSVRGTVADVYQGRGDAALAKGEPLQALRYYRSAVRWNNSLEDTARLRLSRGQAESGTARSPSPTSDAYLYRAQVLADRDDNVRAVEEFAQAHQRAPQSAVIKRLWAAARVRWGLNLYRQGNVHLSIQQFEQALETDPLQQQAHFYLAKACYDARDYRTAIEHNVSFLKQCRDRLLRAEVFNNLGDCYDRQRDFVTARQMYQRSLRQYDDIAYRLTNFRARRGLAGM